MSYIDDYTYFGSGHDCPPAYMLWGALSLITHIAGHKIWTMHGDYFTIRPNLYVCNIGHAGSGKSTAMDQNEQIMDNIFPDYMVSESVQSAQHIMKQMADPQYEKTWKDEEGFRGTPGKIHAYRPFYCLVDEMNNFVSVDQSNMIGLLVGIHSRSKFGTGYKKDLEAGVNQRIPNPYFSLMGCAIPEWVMMNLKIDLFVGGLGRRMVIVNAKKERESPNPMKPPGADQALLRAIEHLKQVEKCYGPFVRSAEADKWWLAWFADPNRKNKEDPILSQFHETKQVQLLKVALAFALSRKDFHKRVIEAEDLEKARHALDALDPEIQRLTGGVGRNELAGIGVQLLDYLGRLGGAVPEKVIQKTYYRYLRNPEFMELMNHYATTNQIVVMQNVEGEKCWFLPDRYQRFLKEKKQKMLDPGDVPAVPPTAPSSPTT